MVSEVDRQDRRSAAGRVRSATPLHTVPVLDLGPVAFTSLAKVRHRRGRPRRDGEPFEVPGPARPSLVDSRGTRAGGQRIETSPYQHYWRPHETVTHSCANKSYEATHQHPPTLAQRFD